MAVALSLAATPARAQSDDVTGLVDAFEPDTSSEFSNTTSDDSAQFNRAEQALSQGLVHSNSPTRSFPSPAQIREVVNNKPVAAAPTVRRIKSPSNDLAFLDGEETEIQPTKAKAAPSTRPVIQEPKSPAKQVKAQVVKDSALNEKLAESEERARALERQLSEAKSQLAAAELEISRLSTIIESNSRARLNLPEATVVRKPQPEKAAAPPQKQPAQPQVAEAARITDSSDLQVATITVEKADLRLGPGKNNSALMSLRRGSRLAVEARQGEWYRVFAPNGQRAWIHSSLVRFGDGAVSSNDGSAVTIKGFDARLK